MNADLQYIEQAARQARRRLRTSRLWEGLWQGLALGTAIWVGVLAADKLLPLPELWPRLAFWAVPTAAVVGVLVLGLRSWALVRTIEWMDLQLGLQERLVTAWELARGAAQHPWTPLVVARAAQALRQAPWRRLVRLPLPRQAPVAGALLLVGLTLLWVPEYRSPSWRDRQRQWEAQREAGRELVAFARRELQVPDLTPDVQAALREIEAIGRELVERTLPPEQAVQALADLARRLEAQARTAADSSTSQPQATPSGNNANRPVEPKGGPSTPALASQPTSDRAASARPPALAAEGSHAFPAGQVARFSHDSTPPAAEGAGRGSASPSRSAEGSTSSGFDTDAADLAALAQRLDQLAGTLAKTDLSPAEQQRIASELESLLPTAASSQAARQWLQSAMDDLKAGNRSSAGKALGQAAAACRGAGQGQRLLAASRTVAQAAACVGTGRSWMECSSIASRGRGGGREAGAQPGGDLYNESVTAMPRPAGLAQERVVGPWLPEAPMAVARARAEALSTPARVAVGQVTAAASSANPRAVNVDRIPRAYRQTVRSYFDETQP